MIRTYNGDVDRSKIRNLKRMFKKNIENKENSIKNFNRDGATLAITNLNPFFGCPDEMSKSNKLKSIKEIEGYFKHDLINNIGELKTERFVKRGDIIYPDILLNDIINFMITNYAFPNKDEMKKLEEFAEIKRIEALPVGFVGIEEEVNENLICLEILEFVEEIMESVREKNPDEIETHVEPYSDELYLKEDEFGATLMFDPHHYNSGKTEYWLSTVFSNSEETFSIFMKYSDKNSVSSWVQNYHGEPLRDKDISNHLLIIHRALAKRAREEGMEFTSKVKYDDVKVFSLKDDKKN